ncbi:unnamed protein product [Ascophyllum nodosum]
MPKSSSDGRSDLSSDMTSRGIEANMDDCVTAVAAYRRRKQILIKQRSVGTGFEVRCSTDEGVIMSQDDDRRTYNHPNSLFVMRRTVITLRYRLYAVEDACTAL